MNLKIETNFPGGNARILQVHSPGADTEEIVFAPDPKGGPEALWFFFRVTRPLEDRPRAPTLAVRMNFFANLLGAADTTVFRPVWREMNQPWKRMPPPRPTYEEDGQVSLLWSLDNPARILEIAFCYPYHRPEVERLLRQSRGYWNETAIGLSQGGRPLLRLHNGCGAVDDDPQRAPRGIYLIARQHAGETPGSWVLDGILEGLSRQRASGWRVWAVPFADLDGVETGAYGKDAFPYDLNRAWGSPPMRHEVRALQQDLLRWKQRCRPDLVLDLHAPGACETAGIYTFLPDDDTDSEHVRQSRAWANGIRQELGREYAAEDFLKQARYASRWETPRLQHFVARNLGAAALALETPYTFCGKTLMTARHYREAGRRIARAILKHRG